MDKPTSIIAALNAGKLPSTQQFNGFIDYLEHVGIVKLRREASSAVPTTFELSAQGKVLADDLRDVLSADKKLLNDKNADNILQEAIWHLTQGSITTSSSKVESTKKEAKHDIEAIRQSLRTLLKALYHSFSSERTVLFGDLLSLVRTSLSDALEAVEGKAGEAKEGLRKMEGEVQEGKRDLYGRDKERLEQERDAKVAWEHGVESVKVAGSNVIGGVQGAQEGLEKGQEKTEGELKHRYYLIWKRAQSDPEYRQALNTLFSVLQDRLHAALDTVDPTKENITLSSFIKDPTPEQHIPKGIHLLLTFIERLAGKSLEPLIVSIRNAVAEVLQDERLRVWFDEFFEYTQKVLEDVHYAPKEEAKAKRKDLRERWKSLSCDENSKWHELVGKVKSEWASFEEGLKEDEDLKAVVEAKEKFGGDLKRGLSERVEGRVEQAVEEVTWFWQDLFKVYLPNILGQLKELPIPRTEYKDDEIEFVLENLDISKLNILPSRVYIRNITDISIQTTDDPSVTADKQLATLTHIQVEALQLHLKDVSFWYKDKQATVGPGEFTGLLEMKLPPQGINVDLKVRMIPAKAKGKITRDGERRFHVVERCVVEISDEVEIGVRESNHPMLVNVFSGLVKRRVKEALERTFTGQFRGMVDWVDRVAYDVGERKKVFEDAGLGGGPAIVVAVWSEIGKMEREEVGGSLGMKATGTGIVFEEEGMKLAIGAEPQVLSGEKRGPLGTGSESVKKRVEGMMDVDLDVAGVGEVVEEGKRRVEGFKRAVLRKEREERKSVGKTWKTDAFDF